jgi:hypothetical protein
LAKFAAEDHAGGNDMTPGCDGRARGRGSLLACRRRRWSGIKRTHAPVWIESAVRRDATPQYVSRAMRAAKCDHLWSLLKGWEAV